MEKSEKYLFTAICFQGAEYLDPALQIAYIAKDNV